jgi:hypothetical protein
VAQKIGIPRPSAPGALTDPLRQDVSMYKSLRSVVDVLNQPPPPIATGSISFGSVASTLPDGSPATFTQGTIDCVMIRIGPAGSSLGLAHTWVAGGGDTTIPHGLNRIPLGYWVVKQSQGCEASNGSTAWTTTNIYFKIDHSDTDVIILIF